MTQPSRVIYLPPGLVPATPAAPQQAAPVPGPGAVGVPFDRAFFEQILPAAIASFCNQVECKIPIVEVLTLDGAKHYVNGISGASDSWVALQTASVEHDHTTQIFVPYQTIFRVEIHPEPDARRQRLGFVDQVSRDDGSAESMSWKDPSPTRP